MKIKNKITLPIILFLIIIINYIPLIIPNSISKESFGVSNINMLICFLIEIIILIIYFMKLYIGKNKTVDITEEIKTNFIFLTAIQLLLLCVQIFNLITGNLVVMDVMNIGAIFINILLLYICILNIKLEENSIYSFFKGIIYMTLVACLVNCVLYYKEILDLFRWIYNPDIMVKSFFANRNQFAFFLYLAIISNIFVLMKERKKIYLLYLFIFFMSLITTMSRTGILMVAIFVFLLFLFTNKIKRNTKIIIFFSMFILGIIGLTYIYNNVPVVWQKINNTLIRSHELKTLSGRTDIWKVGIDLLNENNRNILTGVGRFKSIKLLKNIDGRDFTQFHNTYIDLLVTGGILELLLVATIYITVIKKIIKSDLEDKYKRIYFSVYITYFIYMLLESFGRFSIGSSDTICLIFFITIPLLHSISNKEKNSEGEK